MELVRQAVLNDENGVPTRTWEEVMATARAKVQEWIPEKTA